MPIVNGKIVHDLPSDFQGTFGVGTSPTFGKTAPIPEGGVTQAQADQYAAFYGVYDSQPINLRAMNATGLSNFSLGSSAKSTQRAVILTRTASASGAFSGKWDGSALDNNMAIYLPEGPPQAVVNSIPPMTSANTPAPYVLEVNAEGSGFEAWKAFDSDPATYWYWSGTSEFQGIIDLGAPRLIHSYLINPYISDRNYSATSWKFDGSHDKVEWTELDSQIVQPASATTYAITNTTAYRYYRWRWLSASSAFGYAFNNLNVFWNEYTTDPRFSAIGLGASIDLTTIASSSGGTLKITGTESSNGAYISLRLDTSTVPLSDMLQLVAKCDNPSASFRLKLHSTSSATPLAPTAASHWTYEFSVDSSNFKEIYLPDFVRATAMTTSGTYWLTLQVVKSAGGFNLWLDDVRFRKGLGNGDEIQSVYRPWMQYRTVLMTTV